MRSSQLPLHQRMNEQPCMSLVFKSRNSQGQLITLLRVLERSPIPKLRFPRFCASK
jgi:hypothetical protein